MIDGIFIGIVVIFVSIFFIIIVIKFDEEFNKKE